MLKKEAGGLDELRDGLYEKVVSQRLEKLLKQASAENKIWYKLCDDMDPQNAVQYLADYVRHLVQICLKDLADKDDNALLQQELALTNGLVDTLTKHLPELGTDNQIDLPNFLLLELQNRLNHLQETQRPRPQTSLSHSFLFTNSHKDVSLVTELQREIASSDRIDFLVSFIKFSGLTLLLPYRLPRRAASCGF